MSTEVAKLGRAVKRLRMAKGFTQEALAEASGLHRTYISGIEIGKRNPTYVVLCRLLAALDSSWVDLAAEMKRET